MGDIVIRPKQRLPHWKVRELWRDDLGRVEILTHKLLDEYAVKEHCANLSLTRPGYSIIEVTIWNSLGQLVAERNVYMVEGKANA